MSEVRDYLGERLRRLRKERGWSQSEVANRAEIAHTTLSEIENGKYTPGLEIILRLAKTFGVTLEYLLRPQENPFELLLRQAPDVQVDPQVLQEWAERCLRYAEIEKLAGVHPAPTPLYQSAEKGLRAQWAQWVAEQERERLRLGSDPIANLVEIVESQGMRVVGAELGQKGPDGALLYSEETGAFALINQERPAERQRFTLAHEYGHYLMHRTLGILWDQDIFKHKERDLRELESNAFAAAFLMPRSEITRLLPNDQETRKRYTLTLLDWIYLKRHFGVSYPALAWRLFDLGSITDAERDQVLHNGEGLRKMEKTLFQHSARAFRIPSLTDRLLWLLYRAYLREEATASYVAESVKEALPVLLDYLYLLPRRVTEVDKIQGQKSLT